MTSVEVAPPPSTVASRNSVATPSLRSLGVLFFLSGASSLIFEMLFTRLLTYTFGNTAYAVSTVLAAFLGGLALGAYLIGRWVDHARPSIRIYGWLELAIGCYGLFVPLIFAGLTRAYVSLYHVLNVGSSGLTVVRFLLAAIVIIVPSALMGGTLPVLARIVAASRSDYRSEIDWLYAINTLGAATGVLGCTYCLMPLWGIRGAIAAACLMNTVIFVYSVWFAREKHRISDEGLTSPEEAGSEPWFSENAIDGPAELLSLVRAKGAHGLVLASAFLTGLITLSYEVIWTHTLAFLVGSAVYSFGMMLFTFLCGLGAGAFVVSRLPRRAGVWAWTFAISQLLAGLTVVLTLPLWNRVPDLFARGIGATLTFDLGALGVLVLLRIIYVSVLNFRGYERGISFVRQWAEPSAEMLLLVAFAAVAMTSSSPGPEGIAGLWRYPGTYFAATEAFRFFICFYLLIAPAFLLGTSFPALLNLFSGVREKAGKTVGIIYAANTVGSISGSLLTGFLLLEVFGSYATLKLAAILNLGLGLVFFALLVPAKRSQKLAMTGASALALAFFAAVPSNWSIQNLTQGTYVYFNRPWPVDKVLYAREDIQGGLTTVIQSSVTRILLSNGKFQGNNTGEVEAQIRFALIPMLFTHELNRALVIGLGTGNSLRSLSAFPFKRIDVAELAPSVIDAARKWFTDVNADVMDKDPRVHMFVTDGRNHLLLSKDHYNLITIEVSSIWISGEADIYNMEFYELCRSHLTSDGVLQQWVQVHHMRPQDFQVILSTAAQVFPHVAFVVGPEQGLLIASSSPLAVDYRQVESFDHDPGVRRELELINRHSMFSVLGELGMYDSSYHGVIATLAGWSHLPINLASTDEFSYLEYQTPKGNVLPQRYLLNPRGIAQFHGGGLPSGVELRNTKDPEDRSYVQGLMYEDQGELANAINSFNRIQGSDASCAKDEVSWVEGIQRLLKDRSSPIPQDPPAQCP